MMDKIFENSSSLASMANASSGVNVDFDITFLIQAAIFLLLFLILKPLLFNPMIRLIDERERRIDGAKDEARQMYADADTKVSEYEEHVLQVKRSAGQERDRLRAEGQQHEQKLLNEARNETNALLEQGKLKIAHEAESLRLELGAQAQQLSYEIASRTLGREVPS